MSPRKKKARHCVCPLMDNVGHVFNLAGRPLNELKIVALERDELEALYLCDGQDLDQERAGDRMGISRGTVQRLLARARRKMIDALVGQKALVIVGDVPGMQPTVVDHATVAREGVAAVPENGSCRRSDIGACTGPRSCPWRQEIDGNRVREPCADSC